jgi:predicted nuclease of predicted toxin-antitoxin system
MSPRIVRSLWDRDVDAVHVRDRGLLGATDHEIWKFAKLEVRTVVTINGRDFRKLAKNSLDHPGVIVIPSGGSPDAQLDFIMTAITWVTSTNTPDGFSNRYLEVGDHGEITLAEVTYRE